MEAELRFSVMGTRAHVRVLGDDANALAELAEQRLSELDARWSRFRDDSEISRLNHARGAPVVVSESTFGLIERGVRGSRTTAGRYDPTVLGAVVRAGYDRTFAHLAELEADAAAPECAWERGVEGIELDAVTHVVRLPHNVGFDPGGIGKGYAADLVLEELLGRGARGILIDVGGDLRVSGTPPDGDRWRVDVMDPFDPSMSARIATIGLRSGAVATSTRLRRSWIRDGTGAHHLIDPATNRPAVTGLAAVTVIASEGWRAEVLAKAAFVAGPVDAAEVLESLGVSGLLVTDAGSLKPVGAWADFAPSRSGGR